MLRVGAGVARDEVQAQHRQVKLIAVSIFKREKFVRAVANVEGLQAEIAPNTMVFMYHRVAHAQLRQAADDGLGIARCSAPAPLHGTLAVELRFGDDADAQCR